MSKTVQMPKSAGEATLPMDKIEVAYNPRIDFSKVEAIADSMQSIGVLHPIVVRKNGDGKYRIVDGEQRYRALVKLGVKEAPVRIVDFDEQKGNEAQMMANLMRSDLSLIEKARGFAHLLNEKGKYNQKVISNKFGIRLQTVKFMLKLAKAVNPDVDSFLVNGNLDEDDLFTLMHIPQQYQERVLKKYAETGSRRLNMALREEAESLEYFDDVFTIEMAKSSGKLHVHIPETEDTCEEYFTFDKDYAKQVQTDYEERHKSSYQKDAEAKQEERKANKDKSAAQIKAEREKRKKAFETTLESMKDTLSKYLTVELLTDEAKKLIEEYCLKLSMSDTKMILRAFKIEGKFSDMNSGELKKIMLRRVFMPICEKGEPVNERFVLKLIMLTKLGHQDSTMSDVTGLKEWIKHMKKGINV